MHLCTSAVARLLKCQAVAYQKCSLLPVLPAPPKRRYVDICCCRCCCRQMMEYFIFSEITLAFSMSSSIWKCLYPRSCPLKSWTRLHHQMRLLKKPSPIKPHSIRIIHRRHPSKCSSSNSSSPSPSSPSHTPFLNHQSVPAVVETPAVLTVVTQ